MPTATGTRSWLKQFTGLKLISDEEAAGWSIGVEADCGIRLEADCGIRLEAD